MASAQWLIGQNKWRKRNQSAPYRPRHRRHSSTRGNAEWKLEDRCAQLVLTIAVNVHLIWHAGNAVLSRRPREAAVCLKRYEYSGYARVIRPLSIVIELNIDAEHLAACRAASVEKRHMRARKSCLRE